MLRGPRQLARCTSIAVVVTAATLAASACGSRGPLEVDPAAIDAGALDAAVDAGREPESVPPPRDAGREGGDVLACGGCLVQRCSSTILACAQAPECRATFQCALTNCLGGAGAPGGGAGGAGGPGGLDMACLLRCAQGNPQGAATLLGILQCVGGTCGGDCNSVLAGLSGFAGGGPGPGGGAPRRNLAPIADAFAAWPELCSAPLDSEPEREREP